MKKHIINVLIASLLFVGLTANAQQQTNYHNIHYIDPYNPEYVKGEVLVKFKDEVEPQTSLKSGIAKTGISSVDKTLEPYQTLKIVKVFKETRKQRQSKSVRTIRDFKGKEMEVPALFNIYKLKFDTVWDAKQIIEELQKDENVEFAEPNYHIYTSEVIENDIVPDQTQTPSSLPTDKGPGNTFPNDPLYLDGSQGYLDAINAPAAWDSVTGDASQVIAIIDTGVDWDHPDLDDNIWTNLDEIPDNGIDDDNNGYIDDTRGWDFINNDNNPNDDNSHGTHVAGIAAAEGNNGIGICGVAWNAKIMPVKMLQSSGSGNSSNLASAIEYAYDNGATVINMSLGSYGESIVVKIALENAYAGTGDGEGSMLVAAAGNDHARVTLEDPCRTYVYAPMFPAAYSWVIGVMAEDAGPCNGFSNWDFDGPIAFEGFNYEIQAKGVGIISCKPNGSYWIKSGTSMASPEVAGALALMRQYHPDDSGEEIFAKLIQGANSGLIDIYNGLTTSLVPNLFYIDYTIVDTLPGCDRDGIADAGETIQLYLTIKNAGGQADSVWSKIRFAEFEDTTTANIIDSTSFIGSMSAYSIMTGLLDPFLIEIDSDLANNREIVFEYEIGSKNTIPMHDEIICTIQNGFEVGGLILENTTWTNDRLYIVTDNIRISTGVTLTINPGTIIQFEPGRSIDVKGSLVAMGNFNDGFIKFSKNSSDYGKGISVGYGTSSALVNISYAIFEYQDPAIFDFGNSSIVNINNCIFRYCGSSNPAVEIIGITNNKKYNNNNFYYCSTSWVALSITMLNSFSNSFRYNNIIQNPTTSGSGVLIEASSGQLDFKRNNIFSNIAPVATEYNLTLSQSMEYLELSGNYWGSRDSLYIKSTIKDFFYNAGWPIAKYYPFLLQPSDSAHGIVWKVEINDILINKYDNPSNSSTGLGVIGEETLKFDVYFNREMDTSFTPLLTFGVREPYTQHIIADNASWSSDSTVWTAYYTTNITTGDGIQRVRVANARDDERFEIPIEDFRFEFVIQAASAASIEFYATPGIGKVNLEWPPTPSVDVLGYNLYRFHNLTDSTFSDTLMINAELVLDTVYTDFSVLPGTTYHYMYKTLGTNMVETDYSKKATATPFSAANGDANGDMTVNVLDITTIVSYILNQNPQPFLNDAADVNYDGQINLLDIIGVVNLIMNKKAVSDRPYPTISQQLAYYEWKGHELWLQSEGNLAGLQFSLKLPDGVLEEQLYLKGNLTGFEMIWQQKDNEIECLIFSLDGKTIESGELMILELLPSQTDYRFSFNKILGGELSGLLVEVLPLGYELTDDQKDLTGLLQVQPNPFSQQLQIQWNVAEAKKVDLEIYDLQGRLIKNLFEGKLNSGTFYWDGEDNNGKRVSKGVYLLRLKYEITNQIKYIERKVIFK
ncbi:MAG: peptidase S8/S53 subtilisin kexin sedolisin [Bacteroidetes bacterium]|nr:MAG: peptidase S8/S53 subtilisin kexin sedolisin [Bacteroidota bacterium]